MSVEYKIYATIGGLARNSRGLTSANQVRSKIYKWNKRTETKIRCVKKETLTTEDVTSEFVKG